MKNIFEENELEGKSGDELLQAASEIKDRLNIKFHFYGQMQNRNFNFDSWNAYHTTLREFAGDFFIDWNQKFDSLYRTYYLMYQTR